MCNFDPTVPLLMIDMQNTTMQMMHQNQFMTQTVRAPIMLNGRRKNRVTSKYTSQHIAHEVNYQDWYRQQKACVQVEKRVSDLNSEIVDFNTGEILSYVQAEESNEEVQIHMEIRKGKYHIDTVKDMIREQIRYALYKEKRIHYYLGEKDEMTVQAMRELGLI